MTEHVLTLVNLLENESNFFVIKSGFLWKEGEYYKSWKRRWFVLSWHVFSYYTNKDGTLLKTVELKDYVYTDTSQIRNTNKVFELKHVGGGRSFFIHCESETDRPAWAQAFRKNSEYMDMIKSRHTQEVQALRERVSELEADTEKQRVQKERDDLARSAREYELKQKDSLLSEMPGLKRNLEKLQKEKETLLKEKKTESEELHHLNTSLHEKIANLEEKEKQLQSTIDKLINLPPPPIFVSGTDSLQSMEQLETEKRMLEEEKKKFEAEKKKFLEKEIGDL